MVIRYTETNAKKVAMDMSTRHLDEARHEGPTLSRQELAPEVIDDGTANVRGVTV